MSANHWIKAVAAIGLTLMLASCAPLQSAYDVIRQKPAPVFHTHGSDILTPYYTKFIARGINMQ
jgi:hypothetical protein